MTDLATPAISTPSAPAAPPPAPPAEPLEPGPVEKARRLLRTIVEATFTPRRFLGRWEAEPARYASPLELLSMNGLLVGAVVYLAHVFSKSIADEPLIASLTARSRAAAVVLDGVNALTPVVAVWCQVLAIRVGAALTGGGGGWQRAIRQAGFLAAYYVPVTLATIPLLALFGERWPAATAALVVATLVVEFGYSALGFTRLYRLGTGRAVAAAAVGLVLAFLLQQAFMLLSVAGVVAFGLALPK